MLTGVRERAQLAVPLSEVVRVPRACIYGEARLGQSGQRSDQVGGHAGDQPGAEHHRVDVPVGVVVGEDRAPDVVLVAGRVQVAGGGEDRVDRVVGILAAVLVAVGPVHLPGRGHELHPAHGARGGDVEVAAVVGLDLVDRRQDLPADPVLDAGGLVDRQQEDRHPELADHEVGDAGPEGGAGQGVHEARVGRRRRAVGPADRTGLGSSCRPCRARARARPPPGRGSGGGGGACGRPRSRAARRRSGAGPARRLGLLGGVAAGRARAPGPAPAAAGGSAGRRGRRRARRAPGSFAAGVFAGGVSAGRRCSGARPATGSTLDRLARDELGDVLEGRVLGNVEDDLLQCPVRELVGHALLLGRGGHGEARRQRGGEQKAEHEDVEELLHEGG